MQRENIVGRRAVRRIATGILGLYLSLELMGITEAQFAPLLVSPDSAPVQPANFQEPGPMTPVERPALPPDPHANAKSNSNSNKNGFSQPSSSDVTSALLGGVSKIDALPEDRAARTHSPAVDAVIGGEEAKTRITSDAGNLAGKSLSVRGVSTQQRTPIITDTRVRGERVGQVLAAGSYWAPVRSDLDTMMSKLDSRLVGSLLIIKGPYSPRYGPGFSFVDIDLLATPRYEGGFESHGASSADYQTNGQQWYGRQTFFGGSADWGYRVSYGHRTGSDYETGDGFTLPSSYKSGDLNVALGRSFTKDDRLEFNYLRLDQSDLEFPGLVYDIRYLVTDGYELKYTNTNAGIADQIFSEVWYNRTRFEGDTFAPSKEAQIPQLSEILNSPSGTDGRGITDGDGLSSGYRTESIYGTPGVDHWALGTDLIYLNQELNDIELLTPSNDNNFPLPRSKSTDFGFYVERIVAPTDWLRLNAGARTDIVHTNSEDIVPGVPFPLSVTKDAGLEQNFLLWSTYLSSEVLLNENWISTAGFAYAQRPPTLTEMYVDNAFIGSLQRGLTFLEGDPLLSPERLKQLDLGLRGNYEHIQCGVNVFQAWIDDYITYDKTSDTPAENGLGVGAKFVNTDLAILRGIESFGRIQWRDDVAFFGTLSYVEGEDRSREKAARQLLDPRSGVVGVPREALPGIAPLDSRVGFLWHDSETVKRWAIEFSSRMVARQDQIAASLAEVETPGFTTFDIRSYRRFGKRNLLTAGVENLGDRFYREHLDYRSGFGVFRPGINFYTGIEFNY